MSFGTFTVALLVLPPRRPELEEQVSAVPQNAHVTHLAELHAAGHLLAAGPLLGGDDEPFRGCPY